MDPIALKVGAGLIGVYVVGRAGRRPDGAPVSGAQVAIRVGAFGAVRRYDGDGQLIPGGGTRVHAARDVYFPRSSICYSPPFPAVFRRWGISNSDGTLTAGRICYLEAGGRTWRLLHVAPEGYLASLRPGQAVPPHTAVGRTMPGNFPGGSLSHLHVDVYPVGGSRDDRVDPLALLGWDALLSIGGYRLVGVPERITSAERRVVAAPLAEAPMAITAP